MNLKTALRLQTTLLETYGVDTADICDLDQRSNPWPIMQVRCPVLGKFTIYENSIHAFDSYGQPIPSYNSCEIHDLMKAMTLTSFLNTLGDLQARAVSEARAMFKHNPWHNPWRK